MSLRWISYQAYFRGLMATALVGSALNETVGHTLSCDSTISGLNGKSPVFRKAAIMFWKSCYFCMQTQLALAGHFWLQHDLGFHEQICDTQMKRPFMKGLKADTSRGWSIWLVWAGRMNRSTPLSLALLMILTVMWVECSSYNRMQGLVGTCRRKWFSNQSKKVIEFDQPVSDVLYFVPSMPLLGSSAVKRFPL